MDFNRRLIGGGLLALCGFACSTEPGGQPAMLILTRAPAGWAENGATLPRSPVAQLADAEGIPVKRAGTDVTVTITAGEAALMGTTTVRTDTVGAAAFEDLSMTGTVGPKTLTFSAQGLLGAKSTINLTAEASIAVHDGADQSAAAGSAVSTLPSVLITDLYGNPVSDVTVSFAVSSGGGSITGPVQITDGSGIAEVGSWTLGLTAGTNTLVARAQGLTGSPIIFSARGTGPPPGNGCFVDDQGRIYCVDAGPPE